MTVAEPSTGPVSHDRWFPFCPPCWESRNWNLFPSTYRTALDHAVACTICGRTSFSPWAVSYDEFCDALERS